MALVSIVILLIVIGVLLWFINAFVPMDGKIRQLLNAVVVVAVVLWLLLDVLLPALHVAGPHFGR